MFKKMFTFNQEISDPVISKFFIVYDSLGYTYLTQNSALDKCGIDKK